MARNKYPEVTQEKILDAAKRLFLTKGYENTTIQDIVAELGGLTKGAVYHHFKSKEDIIDAIGTRMFLASNPFDAVRARKDLNGLEKMRLAIRMNLESTERMALNRQAMPALTNSRVLAQMIETNRTVLTPLWRELIEEGNRDGSVHTQYAQELAELLPLLSDLWLAPTIFPVSYTHLDVYKRQVAARVMLGPDIEPNMVFYTLMMKAGPVMGVLLLYGVLSTIMSLSLIHI